MKRYTNPASFTFLPFYSSELGPTPSNVERTGVTNSEIGASEYPSHSVGRRDS